MKMMMIIGVVVLILLIIISSSIVAACKADADCGKYNPDGPKQGWNVCKTNECNECNSGGHVAPSLIIGVAAVALSWSWRLV